MKKILFLTLFIIIITIFSTTAYAADDTYGNIFNSIPDDVKDSFESSEYEIDSLEDIVSIVGQESITGIVKIASSCIKLPFSLMTSVLIICVIGTALELFIDRADIRKTADLIFSVIICVLIIGSLKDLILSVSDCVTSCGVFMYSFLPVFASLLISSSTAFSSVAYTSSAYLFTQFFMFLSKSVITPALIAYFALTLSSSVADNMFKDLLNGIKKGIIWLLTLITTVFTAITSVQSVVTSAADSVAVRTGKYIFGTSIPVVGGYVSEVLNTVIGSVAIMRSSIGLFAIIVIIILFVPVIIKLAAWKIAVKLCVVIVMGSGNGKGIAVIEAFDNVITILLSVMICILIGLILSLSAILALGGVK